MRILYLDIDSLRPDHLGCYGYYRNTSPNIDRLAKKSMRFDNYYVSDAPCLPSRTALWSGRFGFKNGVVSHGGTAGEPFIEGSERGQSDLFGTTGWMAALKRAGVHTATFSPFGQRHAAWHWYAGFDEIRNTGRNGMERADEVTPLACDWLRRNGKDDDWFLHVNLWDPHTPYRTPESFGNPFENDPIPSWITEDVLNRGLRGFGPHSPQEPHGWGNESFHLQYPRLPETLQDLTAVKRWIDGYDTGVRYADEHFGMLLDELAEIGVLDETAVIVTADHGENLGELNVWGDHQTADSITCRVPLIVHWPGIVDQACVDDALHYHFDWAATMIELLGGDVPSNWDGRSFAPSFRARRSEGREFLVVGQGAWACQRGIRFDDYICLLTYHAGYKDLAPVMLYDLVADPHEQHNLADERPDLVDEAMGYLAEWQHEMMTTSLHDSDPLMTVLREDSFIYARGELPGYLERLHRTGRAHHARMLKEKYSL